MPVFWSLQRISERISEIDLADPYQYLGIEETKIYSKLKVPKRLQEWFGARLVVKDLVRKVVSGLETLGERDIEVLNRADGAPYLKVNGKASQTEVLSLSHSHDYVFCAYSPDVPCMGVDIEWIEPRAMDFVKDYFTQDEIDQVLTVMDATRDERVTIIWSAKEAVLKALALGLRVDTRSIQVLFPAPAIQKCGWSMLDLTSMLSNTNSLSLFWRREGDFIQTVCVPTAYKNHWVRIEF